MIDRYLDYIEQLLDSGTPEDIAKASELFDDIMQEPNIEWYGGIITELIFRFDDMQ